jgi:hypothetical protein
MEKRELFERMSRDPDMGPWLRENLGNQWPDNLTPDGEKMFLMLATFAEREGLFRDEVPATSVHRDTWISRLWPPARWPLFPSVPGRKVDRAETAVRLGIVASTVSGLACLPFEQFAAALASFGIAYAGYRFLRNRRETEEFRRKHGPAIRAMYPNIFGRPPRPPKPPFEQLLDDIVQKSKTKP